MINALPELGRLAEKISAHESTAELIIMAAAALLVFCTGIAIKSVASRRQSEAGFTGQTLLTLGLAARWIDLRLSQAVAQILGVAAKTDISQAPAARRWIVLVGITSVSTMIGAYGPILLAGPVLLFGLLWVFGVYRLWSSDEADRAAGLAPSAKRIPVAEDLNTEVWFAAASLIVLLPMLLFRLDDVRALISAPPTYGPFSYLAFISAETIQILPFVGNIEVFDAVPFSDVTAIPDAGRWFAFAFRTIGDVVLISVLLKVVEVGVRISTGADLRRQIDKIISNDDDRMQDGVMEIGALVRRGQQNALLELRSIVDPNPGGRIFSPSAQVAAAFEMKRLASEMPRLAIFLAEGSVTGLRRAMEWGPEDPGDEGDEILRNAFGDALLDLAELQLGNRALPALLEARRVLEKSVARCDPDVRPDQWARLQISLARSYSDLGERYPGSRGTALLRRAKAAYERVLKTFGPDADLEAQALVNANLANTLRVIAKRLIGDPREKALASSARHYVAAIKHFTWLRDFARADECKSYLAIIRLREAEMSTGAEAEHLYGEALALYSNLFAPGRPRSAGWVNAKVGYGNALASMADQDNQNAVEQLEQAEQCYRDALQALDPMAAPVKWAVVSRRISAVTLDLARHTLGQPRRNALVRCEDALKAAISVLSPQASPMEWSAIQNAIAEMSLACADYSDGDDRDMYLEQAARFSRDAGKIAPPPNMSEVRGSDLTGHEHVRAQVIHIDAMLKTMQDRPDEASATANEAIGRLRILADLFGDDGARSGWINIQSRLSLALRVLAQSAPEDAQALLEEAERCMNNVADHLPAAASEVWRAEVIADVGRINLTRAKVGSGASRDEALARSIDAFLSALDTLDPGAEIQRGSVLVDLAEALLERASKAARDEQVAKRHILEARAIFRKAELPTMAARAQALL